MKTLVCFLACAALAHGQEPPPPTSVPLADTVTPLFGATDGPCELRSEALHTNFLLRLEYDADTDGTVAVLVKEEHRFDLPAGRAQRFELAFEHVEGRPARVRTWLEGEALEVARDLVGTKVEGFPFLADPERSRGELRLDRDFTLRAEFATTARGTLVSQCPPEGAWAPDAKALFVRDGRLVFDIGWLGAVRGKARVDDGRPHVAVLVRRGAGIELWVDGKLDARNEEFERPDRDDFVFKIGAAAPNFGGDFEGELPEVALWRRALEAGEVAALAGDRAGEVNTPDFHWRMPEATVDPEETFATRIEIVAGAGFHLRSATLQPLAPADHRGLVASWDEQSFERGREIYERLCVSCHGTRTTEGSLPTALRFAEGRFHNGSDPYRLLQTLEKGYGQMVAQPQFTTAQKYDVVHYLREAYLKEHNPSQYTALDAEYLSLLPRGRTLSEERPPRPTDKPYLAIDFGNFLFWTLQVEEGNIAQKGIAMRVDPGPGGVSQGSAWMLYEHDTMRLAACWTGDRFVDWRGIAFDGSHGTHTSIVGKKHFVFPDEPMWANPATGNFEDLRIRGRDGRPYGPLPRSWVRFEGLLVTGELYYTVGDRRIVETPARLADGSFVRQLLIGPSNTELRLRPRAESLWTVPASSGLTKLWIVIRDGTAEVRTEAPLAPVELRPEQREPARFPGVLATRIVRGDERGPFAVDVFETPDPASNPWHSWMRTSGFDFFADGSRAAVCTWNGDVWIVEGIDRPEGTLIWKRACAGLFQPLGLRIVDEEIYVGCRDMIVKLVDGNGDQRTDFLEVFNSDHQVTEHFHEFAMGLQTDADGNFYYAKSARHALKAVVPQHGTLLRVSPDGSRTDILATGFRAANGVCLNPDGTFVVTDQEGHWNPKNRINWVRGTGSQEFYGNVYGYHDVTDESDDAMIPPLCWITNAFDRSPAELLWVPDDAAWGNLNGSLLNLSYGYGKVYTVPHEHSGELVQGGLCELPIPQFPTGVMRGRFHPGDGQLYLCGMFAWAGNQQQPGGFYRLRATGRPAVVPTAFHALHGRLRLGFSDPLPRPSAEDPRRWHVEAWNLKRTKDYGSKHYDQRPWPVESVELADDGRSVTLVIPDLAPTWSLSIRCELEDPQGAPLVREIHGTIHVLGQEGR